jgi:hypothetical protein
MPAKDARVLASAAENENVSPEIYLRNLIRKELAAKGGEIQKANARQNVRGKSGLRALELVSASNAVPVELDLSTLEMD